MKPFRVSWRLSQPVSLSDRPLHLDALLAWARVREAVNAGMPAKQVLSMHEDLPLETAIRGDRVIWKASALLFKFRSTPFLIQMTKRTSPQALAFANGNSMTTRRTMITQGSGPYKDFDLRLSCQWVEQVEAWGMGDIDAVRYLLAQVPALGKVTRNGWGAISDMKIEPDAEGEEKWRYRTLPVVFAPTKWHAQGIGTVRPPYWRRDAWEQVWEFAGIW